MSRALNQRFTAGANGLTNFLHRRPMLVEVQDVETERRFNPMTQTEVPIRTGLAELLATSHQASRNNAVRTLAAQVMYCDFELYDVINQAQGTPRSRPRLVCPQIDFTPGVDKIPMYYLPWKEDARFSMKLGKKADYFMTAGMHGCKFEVNYDPHSKDTIVSHTNIQPQATPVGQGNVFVQEHVRQGLEQLTEDDVFSNQCPHVLTFGKLSYFWDAIRESGRVHQHMMHLGVGVDEIEEASPSAYQANVVGKRTGDNWTFYYQLTLMVRCSLKEKVKKKKWLGMRTVWKEERKQAVIDVVVAVKKIWPGDIADVPLGTDG